MKSSNRDATAVQIVLIVAMLIATCAAQTSPTAEQRRAGGERTITGCLQREGSAFVIKSTDGTYELNTDRDLTAYVGKQVKISGRWEASGTFTTAPVGNAPSQGAPSSPSGEQGATTPAFVGDLHLHITGTVVGDCAAPK